MARRLGCHAAHVPRRSTQLRARCRVTTAPSQTESKQPAVCAAVWPSSVKQGPTRWASSSSTLLGFLTAWLDKLHRSLRCLAWKSQKYLICTHRACFSKLGLTVVRKPPLLFPAFTAQSAETDLWQENISKCPDVKTVLPSLSRRRFWIVF